MASTYARLDDAEAAGRMNGDLTKAGFIKQVTVLLFGALKTTGPAQHVQIAHRLSPVLVAGAGRFGHHSFH